METIFDCLKAGLGADSANRFESRRLFHGRGQCYPGLGFVSVDWFEPVLSVTLFEEPPSGWESDFRMGLDSLLENSPVESVLMQRRYLPQAPTVAIHGSMPEEAFARRGPLRFRLAFGQRQNCGYFLDMEPGRKWLAERCRGKRVLNLFAYTCAFSVVAIEAGAERVVNVDMSSGALNEGRENHRSNGLPVERSSYLAGNVLKSWGRIRRQGPYDLAIVDPPSFQRGSFEAGKDYRKVARRLPDLLVSGGEALACLNAPELGTDFLKNTFETAAPDLVFDRRLIPDPDFPDRDPERQLKLLAFRKQSET